MAAQVDQAKERAELLWSLKEVYQRVTGERVQVTDLLTDPPRLERFLVRAAAHQDPMVQHLARSLLGEATTPTGNGNGNGNGARSNGASQVNWASASRSSSAETFAPQAPRVDPAAPRRMESFQRLSIGLSALLFGIAALTYAVRTQTAGREPASAEYTRAPVPAAAVARVEDVKPAAPPAAAIPAAPAGDPALMIPKVVLRIHGSNTVGERLSPALVAAFLKDRGADKVVEAPGQKPQEGSVRAVWGGKDGAAFEIHAHGSSTAFVDLETKTTDIGQSSRRIKPQELAALQPLYGDLSTPASEHVIALDGLAVVVNAANPVRQLAMADVARAFSGAVTDWAELGGGSGPIRLFARDDKSGTWDTFKSLVLEPQAASLAASATRFESSTEFATAVANDPQALGFISLSYVRGVQPLAISHERKSQAFLPTKFTVATEDYPLSRRLYYYTPSFSENPILRDYVEFALSPAGQSVVERLGFVSMMVHSERPSVDSGLPEAYVAVAQKAERLSVNFRFESENDRLDSKAVRDLDRVVDFLHKRPGADVLLLGFADASGAPSANLALSRRRAGVVEKELSSRGVTTREVLAFGAEIPIASNETALGKNKNRRVEVWVR